jgi:hypothetical protein
VHPSIRRPLAVACTAGAALGATVPAATASPLFVRDTTLERVQDRAERTHERAVHRHVRLARKHFRLRGKEERRTAREVRDWSTPHLHEENRELRRRNARLERRLDRQRAQGLVDPGATAVSSSGAAPAQLQAIAQCESGGDPGAIGGGGAYRGLYQMAPSTFHAYGGQGDPAAASVAEQTRVAARIYAAEGAAPWPTCGR